MSVGTQGKAAPPGTEDRTEDPWHDTEPSTLDLETPLAVPPFADPPESPPSAQEAAGQSDFTNLSLDELLSLNILGELTDLDTAGDEEESGDVGSTGQPESGGPSPLEDQGGALIRDPYLGPNLGSNLGGQLLGSPMDDDVQVYLDHLV